MRVGLYGINGVYNFGCEAIIRGSYKFLQDINSDSEILYFTYNDGYDKEALKDLRIEIIPVEREKRLFIRCLNKALSLIGFEYRIMKIPDEVLLNRINTILSIGGDIYTIPFSIRNKKKYPYYNHLIDFCNKIINRGVNVVVYGASVGPFGEYRKAVSYFKKNMVKYDQIICREKESVDYLHGLGLNNVSFLPDPAFLVRLNNNNDKSAPIYLGINLSPLSLKEVFGYYNEDGIRRLADLMDHVYERFKIDLLFVPHVISDEKDDNDLLFMQRVLSYMKQENQKHVIMADVSGGFLGIKQQLTQCIAVVSARMHCAINAICENVPTIFLSYSQKSVGMCEYVYRSSKWLINLKDIENDLLSKLEEMLDDTESIVLQLQQRNEEIQEEYKNYLQRITLMLREG